MPFRTGRLRTAAVRIPHVRDVAEKIVACLNVNRGLALGSGILDTSACDGRT